MIMGLLGGAASALGAGGGFLGSGLMGGLKTLGGALSSGKGLQGLVGGAMMGKAMHDRNQANKLQSVDALKGLFSNSQDLIDRSTDWGRFSSMAADDATEAGNQAVRTAAMMGQGGSAMNAIKNRMKAAQDSDRYRAWQQNQANMVGAQSNIDKAVFDQRQVDLANRRKYLTDSANELGQAGINQIRDAGITSQDIFNPAAKKIGGLLNKIPGFLGG